MTDPPLCEGPVLSPRRPRSRIPDGACDCHFHIFDDPSVQVPTRSYTAPEASVRQYQSMARTLGLARGVVVQPSVYGTDNRTTLGAMPGDKTIKRIAVIAPDIDDAALDQMADCGVVGVRVNLLFSGGSGFEDIQSIARRVAGRGWHLQFLVDVNKIEDLAGLVSSLPLPVVFDHMGHVSAAQGLESPGFQTMLTLLERGQIWVKLSGAYRVTAESRAPYTDVAAMARKLISTNPDNLVWGTDWPHPQIKTEMPDDGDLIDLLADWVDNEDMLRRILVNNPERLHGFEPWDKHDS